MNSQDGQMTVVCATLFFASYCDTVVITESSDWLSVCLGRPTWLWRLGLPERHLLSPPVSSCCTSCLLHSGCLECSNTEPKSPLPCLVCLPLCLSVHSVPPDQQQDQCGHQPQRACPHSFSGTLSACMAAWTPAWLSVSVLTACLLSLSVESARLLSFLGDCSAITPSVAAVCFPMRLHWIAQLLDVTYSMICCWWQLLTAALVRPTFNSSFNESFKHLLLNFPMLGTCIL